MAALEEVAWHNNGEVVVVDNDDEATAVSNDYAPEHLKLMTGRKQLPPGACAQLRQSVYRRGKHRRLRR
jgi:Histidinol dehydrogenase